MILSPPSPRSTEPQASGLDYEIVQEQAAALGRLGCALEAALAALAAHDHAFRAGDNAADRASPAQAIRDRLVQVAGDALWCFIIQREVCGLRDQRFVVRDYAVPRKVQNRMGVLVARPSA
jgi:hypothetical protein